MKICIARESYQLRHSKKFLSLLLILSLLLGLAGCSFAPERQTQAASAGSQGNAPFSLTLLNVGQGLSLLIRSNGKAMLYAGGGRNYSSYVVSYLKQHGITSIDYLVASHYDEDHINGLGGAIHTFPVRIAILPDYTADSRVYRSLMSAVRDKGVPVVHPKTGYRFSLGGAQMTVLGPRSYRAEVENNRSIALRIQYGQFRAVATGDAEEEEEQDIVRSGLPITADLYVVGHHGSGSSSSRQFVDAMTPSYAWISCGPFNDYGHPHRRTLNTLKSRGVQIYRTDKQGEVTVFADSGKYWFDKRPCNDWSSGSEAGNQSSAAGRQSGGAKRSGVSASEATYVINRNSRKFHRKECDSVAQMSPKNREYTTADRGTLIREGYEPCGSCRP